jgi:hypothetical protein
MVASIALAGLALRAGLVLRRARLGGAARTPARLRAHLRLAKPAVLLVGIGAVAGPISAAVLRDWSPFATFHAWAGLLAAALFAAAALLGRRLERGLGRPVTAHALCGALALLVAALAAVAGFALLP